MTEATIFNIQRYSVHDGPGIRTLIFFKGCTLRCIWCANPEGISRRAHVRHKRGTCVGCGRCVPACPHGAVLPLAPDDFYVRDEICVGCGACVKACPAGAKSMWGEKKSIEELIKKSSRDHVFYGSSGGVTLGGGEPLLQAEQAVALLSGLRERDMDTAVETAGHYGFKFLARAVPFCNTIHFDLKGWNAKIHKALTGGKLELILNNLEKLDALIDSMEEKPNLTIRIPLLPDFNFCLEDMRPLGRFLAGLRHVSCVEIMPFHNFGVTKYDDLGMGYPLRDMKNVHTEDIAAYRYELARMNLPVKELT